MLENIITSKARLAILRLFFLNPASTYHMRQISRVLDLNVSQVRKELRNLVEAGVLNKVKAGNADFYSLDRDFMFYKEFDGIIRKSLGVEYIVKRALGSIAGIESAFIFGSYVEGRIMPKSDIDVMIIGEPDINELARAVHALEKRLKRPVQYLVYPLKEFREKMHYGFVKNVMGKKKIFLMGDTDVIG
jgi:predicted nucleotidyltransferase